MDAGPSIPIVPGPESREFRVGPDKHPHFRRIIHGTETGAGELRGPDLKYPGNRFRNRVQILFSIAGTAHVSSDQSREHDHYFYSTP
jgi:hypothetical protein